MRGLMLFAGIAVVAAVLTITLVDEGEVATLVTFDARGREIETGHWIVDIEGYPYVRAASPRAFWYGRLRERPQVHLSRGNGLRTVRAVRVEEPVLEDRVDRAMSEKYGSLDRAVKAVQDYSEAVVVRLDPLSAEPD